MSAKGFNFAWIEGAIWAAAGFGVLATALRDKTRREDEQASRQVPERSVFRSLDERRDT